MVGFNSNEPTLFVSGGNGTTGSIGKVGIGTIVPEDILQIGSSTEKIIFGSVVSAAMGWGTGYIGFNASRQASSGTWSTGGDGVKNGGNVIYNNGIGDLFFCTIPSTGTSNQTGIADAAVKNNIKMMIKSDGRIGIGTDFDGGTYGYSTYKLAVNGGIRCTFLKVEPGWSDFVFEKNYMLLSLKEVEQYIKANGHLPEIPTLPARVSHSC